MMQQTRGLPMIVVTPAAIASAPGGVEAAARAAFKDAGPSIRPIITATAAYFDLQPWELLQKRQCWPIMKRRQVAMAVAKSRTRKSLPDIAQRFGGFHHTTVMHAIRVADRDAVAAVSALLDEVRS